MPYGAQKDKEFPRLLCPCNNLLLFRAQRNRQVPHGSTPHRGRGTVLFHLSEHRCPSLSTLAGPLSKQLVNVLAFSRALMVAPDCSIMALRSCPFFSTSG